MAPTMVNLTSNHPTVREAYGEPIVAPPSLDASDAGCCCKRGAEKDRGEVPLKTSLMPTPTSPRIDGKTGKPLP